MSVMGSGHEHFPVELQTRSIQSSFCAHGEELAAWEREDPGQAGAGSSEEEQCDMSLIDSDCCRRALWLEV